MSAAPLEDYAEPDPYNEETADAEAGDNGPELVYPSVDLFVAHLLSPTWLRPPQPSSPRPRSSRRQ